jgi:hypothetical protein
MMNRHHLEPWRESSLPRMSSSTGLSLKGRGEWTQLIEKANLEHKAHRERSRPRGTEPLTLESAVLRRAAIQTDLYLEVPPPARTLIEMIHNGKLPSPVADLVVKKCPLGGADTFAVVEEAARAPAQVSNQKSKPNVLEVTMGDPFREFAVDADEATGVALGRPTVLSTCSSREGGRGRSNSRNRSPSFYAVDESEQQLRRASMRTIRGKSFSDALCSNDVSRTLRSRPPLTAPKESVEIGFAAATGSRDIALRTEARLLVEIDEARDEKTRQLLQRRHEPKELVDRPTPVDNIYRQYAPVPQFERARCDRAFRDYDEYLFLTHDQIFHSTLEGDATGLATTAVHGDAVDRDEEVEWATTERLMGGGDEAVKLRMHKSLREANARIDTLNKSLRERIYSRGLTPMPAAPSSLELATVGGFSTPQPTLRRLSPVKLSSRLELLSMPAQRKIPPHSKSCDEYAELRQKVAQQALDDAAAARHVTLPVYLNLRSFV